MLKEQWAKLTQINSDVNRRPGKTDMARYGLEDFWTEIDDLGGDCEDFALEKRRRLLLAGWPREVVNLATCYTESGEYHAVLLIDDDQGVYVLDNRHRDVMPWAAVPYRWAKRQVGGGPQWENIAA